MHNILRVELIDIVLQKYLQEKSTVKVRIKDLSKILRSSNPLFFNKIDNSKIKKELIVIYPLYKNKKKRTKWFKITKNETLEYISKYNLNIREKNDYD